MIPLSLTLKNFMSYGEERTTVEFAGAHTLCISGDNGNGKSALLDAITYSLWGRTRASGSQSSGEDDLVRLGTEEMEVVFDFRLGADLFRVIRKRNRRTHSGEWQALVADGSGAWRPIGGTGIRETERYLTRLLHMEYETFLNSAYLQQGRADEFTRQKPDTRKKILADILDLSRFDHLEEAARARRSERDMAAKELDGEIRSLEARASEESIHRDALAASEERLNAWTAERTAREAVLEDLRARSAALEERARSLAEREERLQQAQRDLTEWERATKAQLEELGKIDALLARKAEIEGDYASLREVRGLIQHLEEEAKSLQDCERQRLEILRRLDTIRHEVEQSLRSTETEAKAIEERQRRIGDLRKRITQIEPTISRAAEVLQEAERAGGELSRAQEEFGRLSAAFRQLEAEMQEIEEVLTLINAPKSACPVCETDLTGGKREAVIEKQKEKLANRQGQAARLKKDGVKKRQERDELSKTVAGLASEVQAIAAAQVQKKEWTAQIDELDRLNQEAGTVFARLEALRAQLSSEGYAVEERKALREIETRIEKLKSSLIPYDNARATLKTLLDRQVEAAFSQLQEAGASRPRLAEEREQQQKRIDRRREQIDSESAKLEAGRKEISDLQSVRAAADEADKRSREAAAAVAEAAAEVGRSRQAIADCEAAREGAVTKTKERALQLKEKQIYTELAAAFGRAGVQALIIHNVLPEIEDEANRLLSRMTDSAMRVTLTTIREARSRSGQIETLDISITDDAGMRPYEMFSGGEAFRVNFAIRIALSRLLARRAGARLQTLIIDEGFGTQDAKGRERLVEAIQSVQDEFELILVITHVEELKDAFPARIEVVKTAAGSQILQIE